MHSLILLLLCLSVSCSGFTQVTLDADPPVKILELGRSRIEQGTPYTFRPDDHVSEHDQDLRLSVRSRLDGEGSAQEHRWRLWYGYGGVLEQVQTPPVGPDGRLWFHRSRDHILFVQPDSKSVLLVENAWATRMGLGSVATKGEAKAKRAPVPPLRYRRVPEGRYELETAHWTIQVDLPAGMVLLYEEGAGQGKFVHLALPKESRWEVHATQLDPDKKTESGETVSAIATQFLSMGRILENDAFSESYFPYLPDKELVLKADLGTGRNLVIRSRPKKKSGPRPPLILCLCSDH